jgi:flagellar hook-associated protein 2
MSSISFGGLATGLDTGSIITQLVELKRIPVYRLESQKKSYQSQLSNLSTLKTKLTALQEAANAMGTASKFSSLKAKTSDDDALGVTATSDAAPATFEVTVQSLAVAQREESQGFDSKLDSVGSGTISVTIGDETTELNLTGYTSLEGLAQMLNNNVDGLSAMVVNDGSETGAYRLVVRGSEAGTDGAFTLDMSGLSGGTAPTMTQTAVASDASLIVDGIAVTAGSNNPDDIISGVTLNLREEGTTQTVTIERDTEGITKKVESLVKAYNDLFGYVSDQTGSEGVLRDNPTVRAVASRIESIFTTSLSGGLGDITMFAQLGITRGDARQIEFDKTEFEEILTEDFASVRDFFIERDGNLGKTSLIDTAVEDMTDSLEGLFKIGQDALNQKIKYTDSSIERYERSIESYQLTMERKFAAMESMVSQLQAQGNYLMSVTG